MGHLTMTRREFMAGLVITGLFPPIGLSGPVDIGGWFVGPNGVYFDTGQYSPAFVTQHTGQGLYLFFGPASTEWVNDFYQATQPIFQPSTYLPIVFG